MSSKDLGRFGDLVVFEHCYLVRYAVNEMYMLGTLVAMEISPGVGSFMYITDEEDGKNALRVIPTTQMTVMPSERIFDLGNVKELANIKFSRTEYWRKEKDSLNRGHWNWDYKAIIEDSRKGK